MEVGQLYNFVLLIVLVGMLLGVGILALDKFSASTGVTAAAQTSLNNTRTALGTISSTWLSLIITIAVLAIIIGLVVAGFAMAGRRR